MRFAVKYCFALGSMVVVLLLVALTITRPPRQSTNIDEQWRWFDRDGPGIEGFDRSTIWGHAITVKRTPAQSQHPQLAFIKPPLFGGNALSLALARIVKVYNVPLPPSSSIKCDASSKYSLSLRRGARRAWAVQCIPHVRFVTVLTDPVAQVLNSKALAINYAYYEHYPSRVCPNQTSNLDFHKLHSVRELEFELANKTTECRNTPLRSKITLQLMAHSIAAMLVHSGPGPIAVLDWQWILNDPKARVRRMTSAQLVDFLHTQYFLVGVADRLDEFWALIALHMGWDSALVQYSECNQMDLAVSAHEFQLAFPDLFARLQARLLTLTQTYLHTLQRFDLQFAALRRQNAAAVNHTLARFQRSASVQPPSPFPWRMQTFPDGHQALC
ncbi:hypothetical protein BASA81_000073 [Batrachochytrium salamandrivorans]|nr:hypothetical protein BASA81_000073 [Batrachochytrium salamandrivorans]